MADISVEFSELVKTLTDDLIKEIFSSLDNAMVAKALKTVDPKISETILKNLSENDSKEIRNKLLDVAKIEDVEEAQREIISIIN